MAFILAAACIDANLILSCGSDAASGPGSSCVVRASGDTTFKRVNEGPGSRSGFKTLPLPLGEGRGEGESPANKAPSPCPLPRGEGFETATGRCENKGI